MGSRAVIVLCHSPESARKRFGIADGAVSIICTRTGRHFFDDEDVEETRLGNKETSGYSPMTALVIQALRAIGKEHVDEAVIHFLRRQFTEEENRKMLSGAKGTTT